MDEIVLQLDDTPELIIELTELSLNITISDIKPEATIVITELDEPDIIEVTPDLPFYVEVFEWPECPELPPSSIVLPIDAKDVSYNSEPLNNYLDNFKSKSINGGIFITNIMPTSSGNVGNKVTSSNGLVLDSCLVDTNLVTISIIAITGNSNFVPNVTINSIPISLVTSSDKPIFTGSVDIDISGLTSVIAEHEDGAKHTCYIEFEQPPVILDASFSSIYYNNQTELKAGDKHRLSILADSNIISVEVADFGACIHQQFNAIDIDVAIADRGVSIANYTALVRVQKDTGSWSEWFETTNTVKLCNLYPSITVSSITYPNGQKALKNSEQAIVNNIVTNFDTIEYLSIINELSIVNTLQYEVSKVVSRISGTYNVTNYNVRITATRKANMAIKTVNAIVNIANIAPVINILTPYTRLRSGGNNGTVAQQYIISLQANQQLLEAPSLNIPEGTWVDSSFTGSGSNWQRKLQIHDNDAKGTYSFNSLVAKNLAGIVVNNTAGTYIIGGFIFRTLTVPAYPNRETSIGTAVSNTSKLRCTNLSKGASGSLNYAYQASIDESIDKYTITNSDTWYNCDGLNASSNTTGLMQIELEEVV